MQTLYTGTNHLAMNSMRGHLSTFAAALGLSDGFAFESSSRPREPVGAKSRRIVASALVSLTGLGLLVPNLVPIASSTGLGL